MDNRSRLVLGTVQFGLNYGINSAGRPGEKEVRKILLEARNQGLTTIDTAYAYGESEQVLGRCFPEKHTFRVVTKLPPGVTPDSCPGFIRESMQRLRINGLYGLLFHRLDDYKRNPDAFEDIFADLKQEGKLDKYGVSLNDTSELDWLIERKKGIEMIQVPYSILDRRYEPYFPHLKKEFGTEIHTRSAFLQGLYFKSVEELGPKMMPMAPYLTEVKSAAGRAGLDLPAFLLSFPFANEAVDGILTGVDNLLQFRANIVGLNTLTTDIPEIIIDKKHEYLLNPVNWKD
ncbi:MAG: aldo/keto reductase [Roseivirga sp.]